MVEFTGNLWNYPADVVIITTNGTLNKKGECVMGRGCAKEARDRFPDLPKALGAKIKAEGNHPYLFDFVAVEPRNHSPYVSDGDLPEAGHRTYRKWTLISFPVKHQWFERADLTLIRTSALQLKRMLDPAKTYVMPRPGCGNGVELGMRSDLSFSTYRITSMSLPSTPVPIPNPNDFRAVLGMNGKAKE